MPVNSGDTIPNSRSVAFLAPHTPEQPRRFSAGNRTRITHADGIGRLNLFGQDFAGPLQDLSWTLARNPASQIVSDYRSADVAWTGHYAVDRAYTANGLNQYSAAGNATFGYDLNGNLTSDGSRTFAYDVENRLVGASGGLVLDYDPLGRLHQTSGGASGTTRYLYDGDALVGEYDAAGNVLLHRYVHGPGADEPWLWYEGALVSPATRRQLGADPYGSIAAIADGTGNRLAVNTYDEYGIPAATNMGRFQYTGQIWLPDLGMYHYKARVYSPTLGRFMQTDPIGYDDQFNLYAYVGNDPINLTDPTGTHGRGTGFTNFQWRKFNSAQQGMARQLERSVSRVNRALDRGGNSLRSEQRRFERQFGRGTASEANMREVAGRQASMAAALRDDGSNGYFADGKSAAQFQAEGRHPTSFAYVADGAPRRMAINVEHSSYGNAAAMGRAVGHEAGHNVGLRDATMNGAKAYRFGLPNERAAYGALPQRDPAAARNNPDSVIEYSE